MGQLMGEKAALERELEKLKEQVGLTNLQLSSFYYDYSNTPLTVL